jgi:hypothetical protein
MLPILRMISVGGVLLAIVILALALSPPGGSHRQFASLRAPVRGALIELGEHPEWRQLLILAAVRRAGELERLRELPDTPIRLPEVPDLAPVDLPAVAGLPAYRIEADPDDETGSINAATSRTIPIEIGEPSSTELPVMPVEENPPAAAIREFVESPETVKPANARQRKGDQRQRPKAPARARAQPQGQTPTEPPIPFNLLQAFFDSLLNSPKRPATGRSVSR